MLRLERIEHRCADQQVRERAHDQGECTHVLLLHASRAPRHGIGDGVSYRRRSIARVTVAASPCTGASSAIDALVVSSRPGRGRLPSTPCAGPACTRSSQLLSHRNPVEDWAGCRTPLVSPPPTSIFISAASRSLPLVCPHWHEAHDGPLIYVCGSVDAQSACGRAGGWSVGRSPRPGRDARLGPVSPGLASKVAPSRSAPAAPLYPAPFLPRSAPSRPIPPRPVFTTLRPTPPRPPRPAPPRPTRPAPRRQASYLPPSSPPVPQTPHCTPPVSIHPR